MTDKLELKSSHEVIYTVDVADVESIFYCKPTDPDILTVLMKDGKRLYCDEVCPVDSKQEVPCNNCQGFNDKEKCDELVFGYNCPIVKKPVSGLDNGDMPIERWKQAVEAASHQKSYRSSKGLTETRDDYFVDGVQWADEHPIKQPVIEGLEEASKNHAAERYRTTRDRELAEKCKWSFKAGAEWLKNKMEK